MRLDLELPSLARPRILVRELGLSMSAVLNQGVCGLFPRRRDARDVVIDLAPVAADVRARLDSPSDPR